MSDICLDLRSECDFHGVAIDDLRVEIDGSLKFRPEFDFRIFVSLACHLTRIS